MQPSTWRHRSRILVQMFECNGNWNQFLTVIHVLSLLLWHPLACVCVCQTAWVSLDLDSISQYRESWKSCTPDKNWGLLSSTWLCATIIDGRQAESTGSSRVTNCFRHFCCGPKSVIGPNMPWTVWASVWVSLLVMEKATRDSHCRSTMLSTLFSIHTRKHHGASINYHHWKFWESDVPGY